jgi:uncharacterized protein YbaP (TraB family)/predicted Zn-ribbon and HTH transcriptional regulator/putative component of toxin-antitoxin plasmid stabilization module
MRIATRTSLLFLFITLSITGFSQQWPNTLLWRITGHGLTKPSYLYGTMHLQDKRLFQFGDSLYSSLERVEGFALEIDFKEYLDSVFTRQIDKAEDELLEKQRVKIDHKKIDKSTDSLFTKLGIKADRVTKKDLKKIRDYRLNKMVQQGEMETIVDGYLYGLALRMGKWTGGIEDVADQLNLIDEIGGELTPEKVLQPESAMRSSLEQMVKIYVNQDMQSLAGYSDSEYNKEWKDAVLIHRNIKMARRMDSLSNIRTMFFAVGAAHLPGDSGVISLLRNKGFLVEPVFSSQKIAPGVYKNNLKSLTWNKVEDKENYYSIEMPGIPSEHNLFGEALKMQVFFDLTTMTFYMAGKTMGKFSSDADVDKAFAAMASQMGVDIKKVKIKTLSKGDIKGAEGVFEIPEASYRIQLLQKKNTMFLLMAGTTKRENLASSDIDKFFTSFTAKDVVHVQKDWVRFNISEKGLSMLLPQEPKPNKAIDKKAAGSGWSFTTFDFIDNEKGLYYLVQVRDITAGYYLNGDSAYFSSITEAFMKNIDTVIKSEPLLHHGFPAYYFEGISKEQGLGYKIYTVIRGNRVYSLVAAGQTNADFSNVETIIQSLELTDYTVSETSRNGMDGFFTSTTVPIVKSPADTTAGTSPTTNIHYVAFDPKTVISYEIFKQPFPALYWTKDDSSFFDRKAKEITGYGDTVLKKQMVQNGKQKAMEIVIQSQGSNSLKKVRYFINGDTLYQVLAYIPKQYINESSNLRVFDDFRVINEKAPEIYANRAKELFDSLQTKDSTRFESFFETLGTVKFSSEDLPVLHAALLKTYAEPEDFISTVPEKIINELEKQDDPATVQFIAANYGAFDDKEEIKYDLLNVLAHHKTKESYGVLKQLLLAKLPKKGSIGSLKYSLDDSLELTKTLYPEILQLHGDSIFVEALVFNTNRLLDSGLLTMADILPYKDAFLKQASLTLGYIKGDPENWWRYSEWIPFVGKLKTKEANLLLQRFLKLNSSPVKREAILALLKNNQPVNAVEIEKLAADKSFRAGFYDDMKKINKQGLIPAKYTTQQSIAESELYEIATEDYDVAAISFIGERVTEFKGKKQKFYLFNVVYKNEEEGTKESYLGIAGPYSPAGKEIVTYADFSGIYSDEQWKKTETDKLFRLYLAAYSK